MKKLFFSTALLLCGLYLKAQVNNSDLIGTWQIRTAIVGDALHDNYRLFKDGTFTYYFDQYNDYKRIISIRGTYKISNGEIDFKIISRTELVGGKVIKASEGFQSGWVLFGAETKEIDQKDVEEEECTFEASKSEKGEFFIKICSEKYFKISDDPNFK